MLSVPTLCTVFVINFLALGLIWVYVMRSYPKFEAARFWTGSAFAAAARAALGALRFSTARGTLLPPPAGRTGLFFAGPLSPTGVTAVFSPRATSRWPPLVTRPNRA